MLWSIILMKWGKVDNCVDVHLNQIICDCLPRYSGGVNLSPVIGRQMYFLSSLFKILYSKFIRYVSWRI